jgi:hypothetical protein
VSILLTTVLYCLATSNYVDALPAYRVRSIFPKPAYYSTVVLEQPRYYGKILQCLVLEGPRTSDWSDLWALRPLKKS